MENQENHKQKSTRQEVSAVTKMYDFLLWLCPHITRFPREHRYTLGSRTEDQALEILSLLLKASHVKDKRVLLAEANHSLTTLRYLIRLGKDLKAISKDQYSFASESLYTIGKEIGGWEKHQAKNEKA